MCSDADTLRNIILSRKRNSKEGESTMRIVRTMDEPVFLLRRLVLFVGEERCVSTILSLNLKLERKMAIHHYLKELIRTIRGPDRVPIKRRAKTRPGYTRVVTENLENPEVNEGKDRSEEEEQKMDVDTSEEDLEETFARAVSIQESDKNRRMTDTPVTLSDVSEEDLLEVKAERVNNEDR